MATLYPFRFQPLFRRYLWGGHRLATQLGKPVGNDATCAESWELVDHGDDQSIVLNGELSGRTLHSLLQELGEEILGKHAAALRAKPFPLLFKFLDAQQKLSVQVHPDDTAAAKLTPPDLGKTEAWVILAADPGSVIYAGLKRGFDRAALEREVARGTTELCLHRIEPRVGDCIFIPAGTVHALGAGLLVAEIQQASDTTFRLYDWNRVGPDGQPRALHVEASLRTIDYQSGPVAPQTPQPTDQPHVQRLVSCEKFVLDRWRFSDEQKMGGDGRFHIVVVLSGSVRIGHDETLAPGQTALLPAGLGCSSLFAAEPVELLDIYLP